jgi:carbonic anhydrase
MNQSQAFSLRKKAPIVVHSPPLPLQMMVSLNPTVALTLTTIDLACSDCTDRSHIDDLLANNKAWVNNLRENAPEEYRKLGIDQTPKYLYFGCSDSRVPANQILGLGPGEVFVHRNVGNLVPGNDLNALSVLEYAVGHLGVTDIIVTGHYNCGAIKAALTRQDLGMLENWLRLIRDVYRLHRDTLDRIVNEDDRQRRLVELNVIEQCVNVYKTGIVQRKRLQNRSSGDKDLVNAPRIHGLVFDTSNGILQRLEVDYSRVGSLDSIYGLY